MTKHTLFLLFVVLFFAAACAVDSTGQTNPQSEIDAVGGQAFSGGFSQGSPDASASSGAEMDDELSQAWLNTMGADTSSGSEQPFVEENPGTGEQESVEKENEPVDESPTSQPEEEGLEEESKGACDNTVDRDTLLGLQSDEVNVNDLIQGCALSCVGEETCSTNCVVEDMGVSEACGKCFAGTISCTMKHCLLKCMDSESPGCVSCQEENCFGAFELCAGLEPPSP